MATEFEFGQELMTVGRPDYHNFPSGSIVYYVAKRDGLALVMGTRPEICPSNWEDAERRYHRELSRHDGWIMNQDQLISTNSTETKSLFKWTRS